MVSVAAAEREPPWTPISQLYPTWRAASGEYKLGVLDALEDLELSESYREKRKPLLDSISCGLTCPGLLDSPIVSVWLSIVSHAGCSCFLLWKRKTPFLSLAHLSSPRLQGQSCADFSETLSKMFLPAWPAPSPLPVYLIKYWILKLKEAINLRWSGRCGVGWREGPWMDP